MKKQVRETAAGKSISAWIILKAGKHVATVQAHYSDSGRVTVDVWDLTGDMRLQQGSASGYGYDKFTAALSGMKIAGIMMTDHCTTGEAEKKLLAKYQGTVAEAVENENAGQIPTIEQIYKEEAAKIGAQFANYKENPGKGYWHYTSLYQEPGLEKLVVLGYDVIQAI